MINDRSQAFRIIVAENANESALPSFSPVIRRIISSDGSEKSNLLIQVSRICAASLQVDRLQVISHLISILFFPTEL